MNTKPEIVVVGVGYVGLTLSLTLAARGYRVMAIDTDPHKIAKLKQGQIPIFEERLAETLKAGLESGRLHFGEEFRGNASTWIFTIPYLPGNVHHYQQAIQSITTGKEPPLIMIRGTVPIGYIRSYLLPLLERQFGGSLDQSFYLVSLPERSLAGAGLKELETLPQLIGGSEPSTKKASQLFEKANLPFVVFPSFEATELAKVFMNFSRLIQLNLSNYFGILCQMYDLNEAKLLERLKRGYPRLDFLKDSSFGVGGFCLPKDALVLQDSFDGRRDLDLLPLLKNFPKISQEFNENVILFYEEKIIHFLQGCRQIAAFGIAFKGIPRTDDVRGSVGVKVVRTLYKIVALLK